MLPHPIVLFTLQEHQLSAELSDCKLKYEKLDLNMKAQKVQREFIMSELCFHHFLRSVRQIYSSVGMD